MTPQIKQRLGQIRRGEVPEGYKKTKVGLVPEEWEIKKLSDISDEIKEVAGTGKYETLSISAGIGFVNQANKFGKELSGKQYEKYTVLRKGDFAYNKGNSKKYPQGCVYRLKDRDSAAVPNVFECFRIKEGNKNYIEQVFISGFLNRQLSKKINHGVRDDGLLNLTGEDFYKSYIIIPPLPEQEKIAEILQTQDKVIELQQKKIDELKKLKKGYLSKMFPKKGCNVPEIRFPGFADAWEQRKLGDVVQITMGQSPDGSTYSDEPSDYILVQGNADLQNGWVCPRIWTTQITKKADAGDLIMSVRAPAGAMGKTAYNAVIGRGVAAIKGNEFIYQLLVKMDADGFWKILSCGSTFESLNSDNIKNAEVKIPTTAEQIKIGGYFQQLDNLITLHQRKCDEEKQKKKALMQLLLTGIVRTNK